MQRKGQLVFSGRRPAGSGAGPVNPALDDNGVLWAAGVNMLNKPEAAAALAKPIIDELAAGKAELALTSNLGCALHLRQQLFRRSMRTEVMHPVELLARQLQSGRRQ